MRQRICAHLTYANVVATLALFLVLAGGTAVAVNYVVSSNSQIGPGTVSGHKPPTGKHSNIIGGSVNGGDVADNSLTGADVNESSLTGNAHELNYNANASVVPPLTTIATAGPYAIEGRCTSQNTGITSVALLVNGPAGTADVVFHAIANDQTDGGTHWHTGLALGANTDTSIAGISSGTGDFQRMEGTAMLKTGSTVVQVDFDAVADGRSSPGTCSIYGTATRGT
jgi:hypothetical protein